MVHRPMAIRYKNDLPAAKHTTPHGWRRWLVWLAISVVMWLTFSEIKIDLGVGVALITSGIVAVAFWLLSLYLPSRR